ncbi:MAG TPA: SDR family oxidoreductase [Jiangellaceae bacterium]
MKLIIFGATGSVGRLVVDRALEEGHEVTAFTRDPAKVERRHERLTVSGRDVFDVAAVTDAIAGHDAVIVTLGGGRNGGVRAPGTKAIIEAMQAAGVRRLIVQSTLGAGDSRANLNLFWKWIMFGLLLRPAYADHQEQDRIVRRSDVDWTIVRPGAFTDGLRTGAYRRGLGPREKSQLKIARADVADFLLEQVDDDTYVRRAPAISY